MRLAHTCRPARRGPGRPRARGGSVLPLLGVCLIGLFGFVALAVDLGVLAGGRTRGQDGAGVAALVGARTVSDGGGVANSNLPAAVAAQQAAATTDPLRGASAAGAQITRIEANQY